MPRALSVHAARGAGMDDGRPLAAVAALVASFIPAALHIFDKAG